MSREHHPIADLFPMLADDELAELAKDIRHRGLLQPIVLDAEDRILDGRNRLMACQVAGVEPEFTTYDGDDPDGYALSVNIARRHLTKGQQAMVAARAARISKKYQEAAAREYGVSQPRISYANVVLSFAPDLADAVVAGAKQLNDAYREARERKQAAESDESAMARLHAEASDLADQVVEEGLSLSAALDALEQRRQEAKLRDAVREIDDIRDADGAPAPSFTQRADDGSVTWDEAVTLARQWLTERGEAIRRDQNRIRQVISGWGSVRTARDQAGTPYIAEVTNGLGDTDRAELDRIITALKG